MTEQLRFPDQSFACANRTQRFGTDLRIPYHASFSTSRFRSRDSGGETQQARKYFGGLLFNFQVTRAPAHHPSVAGLCSSVFFSLSVPATSPRPSLAGKGLIRRALQPTAPRHLVRILQRTSGWLQAAAPQGSKKVCPRCSLWRGPRGQRGESGAERGAPPDP